MALESVPDPTFAQGILGPGIAIEPSEGRITAPADGSIDVMFETGHAVSMTTADGAELLIHVGIDTVQLEGKHYKACCKAGQQVKKGDVLIEFDPAAIKAEGYQIVTPILVCNPDAFTVEPAAGGTVDLGLLSSGMYVAMVTTVMGLIVGIPAYFGYNYLVARIEKLVFQMEANSIAFMDILNQPVQK